MAIADVIWTILMAGGVIILLYRYLRKKAHCSGCCSGSCEGKQH